MALHLSLMAAPLVKAQRCGMTNLGARQALNGELITNPADRARVAEILAEALGGQNPAAGGVGKGIGNMIKNVGS
jgi:trehalose-6-phosphate synthase